MGSRANRPPPLSLAEAARYGTPVSGVDAHNAVETTGPAPSLWMAGVREHAPPLVGDEQVDVAIIWGGPIAFALDFLPVVGRGGRRGTFYFSAGYAGHGIALASYAGTMLADLLLDRTGPGRALWTRRTLPLPPEPLRWLVVRTLTAALGVVDRRADRAAARLAASERAG